MKKVLMFIGAMLIVAGNTFAQTNKQIEKSAKKAAKVLVKGGWKPCPGALSIEMQEIKSQTMMAQTEGDDMTEMAYISGSAQSTSSSIDAARKQALALARNELVASISSQVALLIETSVANRDVDDETSEGLAKASEVAKQKAEAKLTGVATVVNRYLEMPNGKKQVAVTLFYSRKKVLDAAKEEIRREMEKNLDIQHEKLDQMLGW